MTDHWKATQIGLPFSVTRKFVNFASYRGPEVTDIYKRAALFETQATDAAALIGVPAIFKYLSLGVPSGVVVRWIGQVVYYGVVFLAMDQNRWLIQGSSDDVEQGQKLIGEGPEQVRKRHIQELFGIHERPASRFLSVDAAHHISTFNDIAAHYGKARAGEPLKMIIDAQALAMNVRESLSGTLFKLERVRTH